jgi:peptide/nickel transport system permease protein
MSQILREKGGKAGLVMVLLVVVMAVFGPAIAMDPNKIDIPAQFAGPSAAHWRGTDNLGRDLFARICIGLRTALITALLVVLIAMVAGLILGVFAGYFGRLVDGAMVILFDIISAFPIYIVIFAIVALYGTGIDKLIFVMALIFIPQFGRMARTQTQSLRGRSFIEAERLLGISTPRLLWRHFIPNIIGPMVVVAGMSVPAAITVEAAIPDSNPTGITSSYTVGADIQVEWVEVVFDACRQVCVRLETHISAENSHILLFSNSKFIEYC